MKKLTTVFMFAMFAGVTFSMSWRARNIKPAYLVCVYCTPNTKEVQCLKNDGTLLNPVWVPINCEKVPPEGLSHAGVVSSIEMPHSPGARK